MLTSRIVLVFALTAAGCELGHKSVGNEVPMTGDDASSSSTTDAEGTAGRTSTSASTSTDAEPSTTDEGPAPVGPGCDLGDFLESIGRASWICGYTPYDEDLLQTHQCVLGWDEGSFGALWTRPEEPIAQAIYVDRAVEPEVVRWYEQDSGTIRTWTCTGLSESPDCDVSPLDMCLICAEPSTPEIVCSPP